MGVVVEAPPPPEALHLAACKELLTTESRLISDFEGRKLTSTPCTAVRCLALWTDMRELELELIPTHMRQKPVLRVGEGGCGRTLQGPRNKDPTMPLHHAN